MKISKNKIREIENKRKELTLISTQLKKMFFGIDSVIDKMMHSVEPWYLFPEASNRPYIINLWGMTGCGKTDVVRKFIERLKYQHKFLYFDMGEYCERSSGNNFNSFWDDDLYYLNQQPCIICLDEFQHLRTINEDFRETKQVNIRKVWELIDTGRMEYHDYHTWSLSNELNKLIYFLTTSLKNNVQVQNGVVTNGEDEFLRILGEGREKYNFQFDYNFTIKKDELEKTIKYFIPRSIYEDVYKILSSDFGNINEFEKHVLSLNGYQSVDFLKKVVRRVNLPKTLDLKRALIFIVGNLDEAYAMSHDLNPDNDPDIFHEYSKGITITEIKKELRKRFRLEQIARLGNNHLIYPAFMLILLKR